MNKRICLFAAFFKDGQVDEGVLHLLYSLKNVSKKIILFADSPIQTKYFLKLKKVCNFIECNVHGEYDFGSYKRAFFYAKKNNLLKNIDEIIFCNDSIVGPVEDLSRYFIEKEADGSPDFYGISLNNYGYKDIYSSSTAVKLKHIQTYFFTVSKNIFKKDYFIDFMGSIQKQTHKTDIVIKYEMGLSALLTEKGHPIKAFYKSAKGEESSNPAAREFLEMLDKAFFVKRTMFKKANIETINYIFNKHGFKLNITQKGEFVRAINKGRKRDHSLSLLSSTLIDDYYYFYTIGKDRFLKLSLKVSSSEKETFYDNILLKDLPENEIFSSQKDHYLYFGKQSYFFKVPAFEIKNKVEISFIGDEKPLALLSDKGKFLAYNFMGLKEKNLFPRLFNNVLIIETLEELIKSVNDSNTYCKEDIEIFNHILYYREIDNTYKLFSDKENLRSDNAYEIFKNYPSRNNYFLVDKIPVGSDENLIERNSPQHLAIFCTAKTHVMSFYYSALVPSQIKDIHCSLITAKLIYVPHGMSAGQNDSYSISNIGGTRTDKILCCSDFEKENFERLGHKDVVVTGYPRMDKWYENVELKNECILFFTWRKSLHLMNDREFMGSFYFAKICEIIRKIKAQSPKLKLHFFIHNSNKSNSLKIKKMMEGLKNIHDNINFVFNEDQENFNRIFKESKYLVTDMSSAGFDFSYNQQKMSLFYIDKSFLRGHYTINKRFHKISGGIIVDTIEGILKYLRGEFVKPRNKLFKYLDDSNSERAYEALSHKFKYDWEDSTYKDYYS